MNRFYWPSFIQKHPYLPHKFGKKETVPTKQIFKLPITPNLDWSVHNSTLKSSRGLILHIQTHLDVSYKRAKFQRSSCYSV